MLIALSGVSFGSFASINSASASPGSDFHVDHVDHAVFFPTRAKLDTVSQAVIAWNIGCQITKVSRTQFTSKWWLMTNTKPQRQYQQ